MSPHTIQTLKPDPEQIAPVSEHGIDVTELDDITDLDIEHIEIGDVKAYQIATGPDIT